MASRHMEFPPLSVLRGGMGTWILSASDICMYQGALTTCRVFPAEAHKLLGQKSHPPNTSHTSAQPQISPAYHLQSEMAQVGAGHRARLLLTDCIGMSDNSGQVTVDDNVHGGAVIGERYLIYKTSGRADLRD